MPTFIPYQTGFIRWHAAENGFAAWTLSGVRLNASGALEFDPASAATGADPYAPGAYHGQNCYNGGSFFVGEATSPVVNADFACREAIASWSAVTPPGAWLEIQIRARFGARWSKWYSLGVWAEDNATVRRHSVDSQKDDDGAVYSDTFVATAAVQALQLKLRLFSADGSAVVTVRDAGLTYSPSAPKPTAVSPGNSARWQTKLEVPACSQMVYPDGGNVWCSPTSVAMVLAYWRGEAGPCEPRVRAAVAGVYDWVYEGHGNWSFNAAYAAAQGCEACVRRLASLEKVEEWVAAGVPVIVSIAWKNGQLPGAPIPTSNGHLMVVVGFDGAGNPLVNDPAAPTDAGVQRIYPRAEFKSLWLETSGGTVYLVYPPEHPVPA